MAEKFFIGRDEKGEPLFVDPRHLTTHAVCVGMTGSGKTGLCISILEEAALAGVSSIVVDIKGDMGNLMLSFPELTGNTFLPWVSESEAVQKGLSKDAYAASEAQKWREGLAGWGIDPSRIARMRKTTDFRVLTPGSGIAPVSILSTLEVPELDWDVFEEELREKIKGIVSALLGIVGLSIDPMEKNHILLSTIIEKSWRKKESLRLENLVSEILAPPFKTLGVMDVETFMPREERQKLSFSLNSLIASPSFENWISGEPLDMEKMVHGGKPALTVFYLAHLDENEKMFFLTLLLHQFSTWMHSQQGTGDLRAILYIDEIFGFIPPYPKTPPSKTPLLLLLKQARAFGCCIMLTTQNPVDLDYKGLTNAGIWLCGKLQTENDKERLLEGLEGIEGFKRSYFDHALSGLAKRAFILHNVHDPPPKIFSTRWAMSYLAGPLTKAQIKTLVTQPMETKTSFRESLLVAPELPDKPAVLYLSSTLTDAVYTPALLFSSEIRYEDKKSYTLLTQTKTQAVPLSDTVEWDKAFIVEKTLSTPQFKTYSGVPEFLTTKGAFRKVAEEYEARLQNLEAKTIFQNQLSGLYSTPDEERQTFVSRVAAALEEKKKDEMKKLQDKYEEKIAKLEEKIRKEKIELEQDKEEVSARKREEMLHDAESVAGFIFGRKSMRALSSASRKRSMTRKAEQDVAESEDTIQRVQEEADALEKELTDEVNGISEKYKSLAADIREVKLVPKINIRECSLLWIPKER